jgi:hypothetical protein
VSHELFVTVQAMFGSQKGPSTRTPTKHRHFTIHADRLQVAIHGAPPLDVAFGEVGVLESELGGVGGAPDPLRTRIELG